MLDSEEMMNAARDWITGSPGAPTLDQIIILMFFNHLSCDLDVLNARSHLECRQNMCTEVQGAGENQCSAANKECTPPKTCDPNDANSCPSGQKCDEKSKTCVEQIPGSKDAACSVRLEPATIDLEKGQKTTTVNVDIKSFVGKLPISAIIECGQDERVSQKSCEKEPCTFSTTCGYWKPYAVGIYKISTTINNVDCLSAKLTVVSGTNVTKGGKTGDACDSQDDCEGSRTCGKKGVCVLNGDVDSYCIKGDGTCQKWSANYWCCGRNGEEIDDKAAGYCKSGYCDLDRKGKGKTNDPCDNNHPCYGNLLCCDKGANKDTCQVKASCVSDEGIDRGMNCEGKESQCKSPLVCCLAYDDKVKTCRDNLECKSGTKQKGKAGDKCYSDSNCETDLRCGKQNVCVAKADVGWPCISQSGGCGDKGNWCCGANGEQLPKGNWGWCQKDKCTVAPSPTPSAGASPSPSQPVTKKSNGESCQSPSECKSNYCCKEGSICQEKANCDENLPGKDYKCKAVNPKCKSGLICCSKKSNTCQPEDECKDIPKNNPGDSCDQKTGCTGVLYCCKEGGSTANTCQKKADCEENKAGDGYSCASKQCKENLMCCTQKGKKCMTEEKCLKGTGGLSACNDVCETLFSQNTATIVQYDRDKDGYISSSELTAVDNAYFQRRITRTEAAKTAVFSLAEFNYLEAGQKKSTISLSQGWNMVSAPGVAIPLADLASACSLGKGGRAFFYGEGGYIDVEPDGLLEPLKGYWVYANAGCNAEVAAGEEPLASEQLHAGWNMVSSGKSWGEIKGDCDRTGNLWAWNPSAGQYDKVYGYDTLDPTKGYWAKVKKACTIIS